MSTSFKTPKYRPYLSVGAMEYIMHTANTKLQELNFVITPTPQQSEELAAIREIRQAIGKILLSIDAGKVPDYTANTVVKASIEDKLGLTQELTDEQKLAKMSKSEQLQFWITYNKTEFGIEPTAEQLAELAAAKNSEYLAANNNSDNINFEDI